MPRLPSPFMALIARFQQAVHRPWAAHVHPILEQRGVNGSWRCVDEALGVQELEHADALLRRQFARLRSGGLSRRSRWCRTYAPVECCSGGPRCFACCRDVACVSQLHRCVHELFSDSSSLTGSSCTPKISESFFWISITFSACASFLRNRAFSRSAFASASASGERVLFGPRLRPKASNLPALACTLQFATWDEYSPSRRSRAPISPVPLQTSAWATICALYAAVKRR